MRDIRRPQLDLFVQYPTHNLGQELKKISEILERHPEFTEWVHADLCSNISECGDNGMTSEQVLRSGILKQLRQWSYEEMAFQLEDSESTQAFLFLGHNECYRSSCLQSNVKLVSEQTWDKIHLQLLEHSKTTGMETGKRVRTDSTVVESNIHHPTDSTLIYDCLRILLREFKKTRDIARKKHWRFSVSIKDVKSLIFKIRNCKNNGARRPHYKKLIKIAEKAQKQLNDFLPKLEKVIWKSFSPVLEEKLEVLQTLQEQLDKIIYQADRRVIQGKKVKVKNKIVSVVEPHTDIIVKDGRDTYFGHKIFITSGQSNLVLDCQVTRGNSNDKDMFLKCLDEVIKKCGRVPLQVSADGGFASQENVREAKEKGVRDVCFGKPCGMKITDMVKSTWVFNKLRNWRAGIEGIISFLKRGYGLGVCNWKGFSGFCCYVKSAIVTYNLTIMARYELQ